MSKVKLEDQIIFEILDFFEEKILYYLKANENIEKYDYMENVDVVHIMQAYHNYNRGSE